MSVKLWQKRLKTLPLEEHSVGAYNTRLNCTKQFLSFPNLAIVDAKKICSKQDLCCI